MQEEYKPHLNSASLEKSEPKFLKDERFLEFLQFKEVDLSKYKDDFIEIWELPKDLYIEFHNSFNHDLDRTKREFNNNMNNEQDAGRKKLLGLLLKLLETLHPITVGQLLKVFREIKRNAS